MSGRTPVVPLETRIRRTGGQLTVTGLVGSRRLSEVATDMFLAIDGERDVDGIAAAVAGQYGVEPAVVAGDLRELLDDLVAADAIGYLD